MNISFWLKTLSPDFGKIHAIGVHAVAERLSAGVGKRSHASLNLDRDRLHLSRVVPADVSDADDVDATVA